MNILTVAEAIKVKLAVKQYTYKKYTIKKLIPHETKQTNT